VEKRTNPQIRRGKVDLLVGFEPVEAVRRGVTYLKEGGVALFNTHRVPPVKVVSGRVHYPSMEELFSLLGRVTGRVYAFDATGVAERAGDPITTNIVMLGAVTETGLLSFGEEVVLETLKEVVKPRFIELNLRAFPWERGLHGAVSSTSLH